MEARLERLGEITRRYAELCAGLSAEQLNCKPNPAMWSIGQVLEHVMRTNASYFPVVEALHAGTYTAHWLSRVPGMPGFFGSALLKAMRDGRRKRHKTFPVWEPAVSNVTGDILDRFQSHQELLGKVMRSSQPLLEAKVVISSPAKRFVVYSLADAFEIMLAHEERHLLQIHEILDFIGRVELTTQVMDL